MTKFILQDVEGTGKAKKKSRTSSIKKADAQSLDSTKDQLPPATLPKKLKVKKDKGDILAAGNKDSGGILQAEETHTVLQEGGRQPKPVEVEPEKKRKKKKKLLIEDQSNSLLNGTGPGLENHTKVKKKNKIQEESKKAGPVLAKQIACPLPNGVSASKQKSHILQSTSLSNEKSTKKPKDKHRKSQPIE